MKVMDVSQIPQRNEYIEKESSLQSRFSLRFLNPNQEKTYNDAILSDIASSLGLNRRELTTTYLKTYYIVSALYISSYMSTYFEEKSNLSTLLFQVLSLSAAVLVTSTVYYYFVTKKIRLNYKSLGLIGSYLISVLVIVFNSCFIRAKAFPEYPEYGFFTILGVLPLFYCSKLAVFNNFLVFFVVNLAISITYIIINLISLANSQRTIIEFLFLLFVIIIESHSFYTQEALLREKFINIQIAIAPELKKLEIFSPKTDIEEISQAVKESIRLIPLLSTSKGTKSQVCIEKIFNNLTKVIHILGSRDSIYSLDIAGLDKNLDNEDKIFLEETCIKPRRSQAKHLTKYMVRKTIEVLKNYDLQELKGILKRIGKEWNFDIFFLKDCTQGRPLQTVACFSIKKYNLDTSFLINPVVYERYFEALEQMYRPNPYHNSAHAADVLCSYLYIANQTSFKDSVQDYEILAIIIAMLGHDVGHPGLNNRFLINSKDPLSVSCNLHTDNDYSVLEMMHSAKTFELMRESGLNILGNVTKELFFMIRALIIEMILATDMAKHFDLIGKFRAKLMNSTNVPLHNPDERAEVMKIITKASDVGHAAKSQELHQRWTELICEEFFKQGELEKEKGLPVSMYCDREKTDVAKSQIGFIKNIALPIYEALSMCFDSLSFKEDCVYQLEINIKMWESMVSIKRVMTLGIDVEESHTLKGRTETTVAGKTGRNSWATLVINT